MNEVLTGSLDEGFVDSPYLESPVAPPREPLMLRPQGEILAFAEHYCDAMQKHQNVRSLYVVDDACDLCVFSSAGQFYCFIKYCPWCGERLESKEE